MKNIIIGLLVFACVVVALGFAQGYEQTYTIEAVVVRSGVVECERGHIWECDTNGLEEGQRVTLKMHTNGTDGIIKDDIIKEIK